MKYVARYAKRVLEARCFFLFGAIFFWVLLDVGYRLYVSQLHTYEGFYLQISLTKYFESAVIYIALVSYAPRVLSKPSDYYMVTLIFGLMAPFLLLYALAGHPRLHMYMVVGAYVLLDLFRRGRPIRIPFVKYGRKAALYACIMGVLAVTFWFFASGGYRYFNLDFAAVYEFRREAGEVINAGLMGYINIWAFNIFGPMLLAVALWRRRYLLAVAMCAVFVLWFGVSSHKSVLFYPLVILFVWVWFSKTLALSLIPMAFSLVVIVSLFVFVVHEDVVLSSLFVRRLHFTVANNVFVYYDFFSKNEFVFWSNSIAAGLIDYPYSVSPATLIGQSRGGEAHVNSSFLSTGFMHAGVVGIVIYSVIAGVIFRLIDSTALYGIPPWLSVAVLIIPVRAMLLNSDLPTALLTHGLGVGLIVLVLMRVKEVYEAPAAPADAPSEMK